MTQTTDVSSETTAKARELPEPRTAVRVFVDGTAQWVEPTHDYYTAEEMRAYAQAAIEAALSQQPAGDYKQGHTDGYALGVRDANAGYRTEQAPAAQPAVAPKGSHLDGL